MRGSVWAIAAVVTLLVAGCGTTAMTTNSTAPSAKATASDNGAKAGASTVTFIDKTMPKLKTILRKWNNGDQTGAWKIWRSIDDVPVSTAADNTLADDYLVYANNVRYYMIGDGSATLKDVESSRAKAQATLADLRP